MWPMQDEGQESGPIRPRDVKSNRSYAKGPVPGFYRVQEPGGYLLKINKIKQGSFEAQHFYTLFCF